MQKLLLLYSTQASSLEAVDLNYDLGHKLYVAAISVGMAAKYLT